MVLSPSVTKLAGDRREPSIVEGYIRRICVVRYGDGVLGIGKPIEHGLGADDSAAQELVIDADLTTTQELSVICRPEGAPKRV